MKKTKETNFTELLKECEDAPATWVTPLLRALVDAAVKRDVFKARGLTRIIQHMENEAKLKYGK